jgi:hypothetical protein
MYSEVRIFVLILCHQDKIKNLHQALKLNFFILVNIIFV